MHDKCGKTVSKQINKYKIGPHACGHQNERYPAWLYEIRYDNIIDTIVRLLKN